MRTPSANWSSLALLSLGFGCARGGDPSGGQAARDTLLAEGRALGLFAPSHVLFVVGVLAAGLTLDVLSRATVRLVWSLGFDAQRRWARRAVLMRWLLGTLVAAALLRGAFSLAPALTSALSVILLLGAVMLSSLIPNALAGAGLTLGRGIRAGDRVRVGPHEGVVREIGLLRTQLNGPDGTTVRIPNKLLVEQPTIVERARHSVPVRVRISLEHQPDALLLERLRHVALLSPYRAPGSLVDVTRSPEDPRLVSVELQAWAASAQRDARAQLEAALYRAVAASAAIATVGP